MDSVRINYYKIGEQNFSVFIDNIKKNGGFIFKAHHPTSETVMQDRYTFSKRKSRVSIVYETKPQTLIITAPENVIDEVKALLPGTTEEQTKPQKQTKPVAPAEGTKEKQTKPNAPKEGTKAAQKQAKSADHKQDRSKQQHITLEHDKDKNASLPDTLQSQVKESVPSQTKATQKQVKPVASAEGTKEKQTKPNAPKEGTKAAQKQAKSVVSAEGTKAAQKQAKSVVSAEGTKEKQAKPAAKQQTKVSQKQKAQTDQMQPQDKGKKQEKQVKPAKPVAENSFIVKKIAPEKFSELIKKIKANKNMRYKQTSTSNQSKSYNVNTQKEKVIIKYSDGNIELSGTRGDLYGEIQLYMSQLSDYKTAIKTHIEFSGEEKKARDIERQLKKKLPDAFEFLSEQSKLDLAIGIIDINNSEVVLSDYSTLLIPCFRGLERLIFDLQHAQGIVVKMIGQAFEKEDGNYVLKSGYRRKIPSVIYPEVMAALYSEYFKQRNFYAHSDGGFDNISRIISDKEQVRNIFNHILDVINYNGKKLKEIGFSIR